MDEPSRKAWGCLATVGILATLALLASCLALPFIATLTGTRALASIPTPTRIGGYSAVALRQLPETQLVYPGADIFTTYATEQISGLAKPWYAVAGFSAGSQANRQDVERWYDQQLQARGWIVFSAIPVTPVGVLPATTVPRRGVVWQRGDLFFRLTFNNPVQTGTANIGTVATHQTLFSVAVEPRR